jgi:hypothetical protein
MSGIAECSLILNGQPFAQFSYDGGNCTAFSGAGLHRNNPMSGDVPNGGAIPLGRYYIVDRPTGGLRGPIEDWLRNRNLWFALWRDDGVIDDSTVVDYVQRGQFRLHPKGPLGLSTGCITIEYRSEFDALRAYLLGRAVAYIPGTTTRTYGTVAVVFLDDALDPRYRPGDSTATRQA